MSVHRFDRTGGPPVLGPLLPCGAFTAAGCAQLWSVGVARDNVAACITGGRRCRGRELAARAQGMDDYAAAACEARERWERRR